MKNLFYFRTACIAGASAIIFGAFGAHALKERLNSEMLAAFEVGVRYQMYHAIAMLTVCLANSKFSNSAWASRACMAWLVGIVLFSGSLYTLALTDVKWFGAITPIGGLFLIVGWVLLFPAAKNLSADNS